MSLLITLFIILKSVFLLNGEVRIVGGIQANQGQFPYQVSIQINTNAGRSHTCGGSLINLKHILTAAHCVDKHDPSDIIIWAGGVDLRHGGEMKKVQSVTIHDKWNRDTMNYDIAIIKLTEPFTKSKSIEPIVLRESKIQDNAKCIVSGWGTTSTGGSGVMNLRFAEIQIFNHDICNNNYIGLITNNMICAKANGKDACQGDSGGPLAYNNTLVGIVSFGYECALPNYPGVYTNVSNFINWIQEHSLASCTSIQDIQIIAMIIATSLYTVFFR